MNAHASIARRSVLVWLLSLLAVGWVTGPGRPAHAQKAARDVLAVVPDDTVLLASVDLARARTSKMFAKALSTLNSKFDQDDLLVAIGLDPARDLDRVVLAVAGSVDKPRLQLLIGEGRINLDPAKLADKAKVHRGVSYFALDKVDLLRQGKKLYATGSGQMPELLDLLARKRTSASKSRKAAELRAALASVDLRSDAWVAMRPDKGTTVPGGSGTLMWVAVAVAGTRNLAIDLHGKLDSEAAAAEMVAKAQAELGTAKTQAKALGLPTLSDSLSIQAAGPILTVSVTIPEAEQEVLLRLLSAFI